MRELRMTRSRHDMLMENRAAIKALLMEMAKAGEPRPAEGTVLHQAFTLFTNQTVKVTFI